MLITKGYKYRIYPNNVQEEYINSIFGSCRFVYNHFLEIRSNEWKDNKKSVSYKDTSRMLTLLKSEREYDWLKSCDSMALQESLKDLDKAYRNFFAKRAFL
ncbi:MAG: helix-turn-helix domain-containing protein [Firmicutes bacterium]|nr:helix-turn-helix domain-containing protein [Bacillota bacterium]